MVITFQAEIDCFIPSENLNLIPKEIISKKTSSAFQYYEDDEFPTFHDFRRLLVRLLNNVFKAFLLNKVKNEYELSSNTCFYYNHNPEDKVKGKFLLEEKEKNIGVTGKYFDSFWHYAISFRTMLSPEPCFSIKNHLLFSSDGETLWEDQKKMHKARRSKGKRFFNKEWRDLLLAFLSTLSENFNDEIVIPVSLEENLVLSTVPILFNAPFSYIEPTDENRLIPIDDFLEEEEFYQNELNEFDENEEE